MDPILSELNQLCFHADEVILPQRDRVAYCLESLWFLIFPDHRQSSKYFLAGISKGDLDSVMVSCREELIRQTGRAQSFDGSSSRTPALLVEEFLVKLPAIKQRLLLDAKAAFERDPAAASLDEVLLSYPGFLAIMTYRIAHELALLGIPLIPRMMSEYAHALTGCDIHPDARIGDAFFIDHATGVVIGQTSVIGSRVTMYQGVTLGARAVAGKTPAGKRHPTIEEDVVLYAHATILGGRTIIGRGSVIGGSCWITSSVPPGSKVMIASSQTVLSPTKEMVEYIPNWDI